MSHAGSSQVRIEPSASSTPSGQQGSSVSGPKVVPTDDRTVISDRPPLAPQSPSPGGMLSVELGKLLTGDRLGHFELLEYVGGGGMGAVFRARDTMLDREVALKVLSRAQGADEETRRRFHVEAQSAARLDHQNIARVYYVGEDQGLNFIVFEFIRGVNVRDLVERHGTLSLDDAISFTLQIAEALAHTSQRSVVHRDIKPSNIIVTEEGRAKLVDMGLARLHAKTDNDDLTASGVTLGTFDYISPEQAREPRTADVRSDIYSLGCTLYYMLTARPPFPEGTVLQKLLQHEGDEAPDPRQFNPDLPEEVAILLRKMLAKKPRDRFQGPGELIGELLMLADRLNLRPMETGRYHLAASSHRITFWEKHLPWIAPITALVLIAAGLEWFGGSAEIPLIEGPTAPAANSGSVASAPPRQPRSGQPAAADIAQMQNDTAHPAPREDLAPTSNSNTPEAVQNRRADSSGTAATTSNQSREPVAADEPISPRKSVPTEAALSATDSSFDFAASPTRGDLSTAGPLETPAAQVFPQETLSEQRQGADRPAQLTTSAQEGAATTAPSGVSILPGDSGTRRQFGSLKAACSVAKNNDVIELQYSGVRIEEPIELSNLRLTIRAGDGFRPVVAFRPARHGLAGFGRSMITVSGGRLTLLNLGLEMDIPRDATAESWSLFETRQAEQLVLDSCTLTVRNPGESGSSFHDHVSFFEIKAAPGMDSMMRMPESPPIHPVDLELRNCIARGEAVFVRSPDAQPLNLDWQNGMLVTTEVMLLAEGTSVVPPSSWRLQINLNHLTAFAHRGLIRLVAASDTPYLPKTEVTCGNSFLVTREAPLVEQIGPQRAPALEQQFQWSGDRNFCIGVSPLWQLVDLSAPTVPRFIYGPQWQTHWGRGDNIVPPQTQLWKRTGAEDRHAHTARRDDFILSDRARATGQYDASDAGDVGMEWRKLPELAAANPLPLVRPRDTTGRAAEGSPEP